MSGRLPSSAIEFLNAVASLSLGFRNGEGLLELGKSAALMLGMTYGHQML
jgi:hypothetical protein